MMRDPLRAALGVLLLSLGSGGAFATLPRVDTASWFTGALGWAAIATGARRS